MRDFLLRQAPLVWFRRVSSWCLCQNTLSSPVQPREDMDVLLWNLPSRSEDTLYWARKSLGEWIYRIVQWKTKRWATWSGSIHHTHGGEGADWRMAKEIQSNMAAQCLALPTSCSWDYYTRDSNLESGTIDGGQVNNFRYTLSTNIFRKVVNAT